MAKNYDLLLLILRKWSVDKTKGTRCYGFHLRELARSAFPKGNIFKGSEAENHQKLQSLLRLASNKYGNEIPFRKISGGSGFSLKEIQSLLSEDYISKNEKIVRIPQ